MYSIKTGLVLGFHGTEKSIRDQLVHHKSEMVKSENEYDWLGSGYYFWENDLNRAIGFANELKKERPGKTAIKEPSVLGAVIDLGYCLDLLNYGNLRFLKDTYEQLEKTFAEDGMDIPENKKLDSSGLPLKRYLDRAVIELLHNLRAMDPQNKPFDSVRAVFTEGNLLYPNAGFYDKSHIQICVRNINCIKGFFIPREEKKA